MQICLLELPLVPLLWIINQNYVNFYLRSFSLSRIDYIFLIYSQLSKLSVKYIFFQFLFLDFYLDIISAHLLF